MSIYRVAIAITWHLITVLYDMPMGTYAIGNSPERNAIPDNKVHGANMGPTGVLSAPDGPHVGLMNLAIGDAILVICGTSLDLFITPSDN